MKKRGCEESTDEEIHLPNIILTLWTRLMHFVSKTSCGFYSLELAHTAGISAPFSGIAVSLHAPSRVVQVQVVHTEESVMTLRHHGPQQSESSCWPDSWEQLQNNPHRLADPLWYWVVVPKHCFMDLDQNFTWLWTRWFFAINMSLTLTVIWGSTGSVYSFLLWNTEGQRVEKSGEN